MIFFVGMVARADVVVENTNGGSNSATASFFYVKFTTLATSNQLTTIQLFGGIQNASGISFDLRNSANSQIANGSGGVLSGGVLTLNTSTFGADTYWLGVSGLNAGYNQGSTASLTSSDSGWISEATMVTTNQGSTSASGSALFQVSLTAAVPEPGTMLLGGIAAAVGGAGAWWKRRKQRQAAAALAAGDGA